MASHINALLKGYPLTAFELLFEPDDLQDKLVHSAVWFPFHALLNGVPGHAPRYLSLIHPFQNGLRDGFFDIHCNCKRYKNLRVWEDNPFSNDPIYELIYSPNLIRKLFE